MGSNHSAMVMVVAEADGFAATTAHITVGLAPRHTCTTAPAAPAPVEVHHCKIPTECHLTSTAVAVTEAEKEAAAEEEEVVVAAAGVASDLAAEKPSRRRH